MTKTKIKEKIIGAEDIYCQSTQGQNNAGYCEDNNNDYCEARIAEEIEYEAYLAEEEESLAADMEAYEALLAEIAEEEEFEYFMARAEDYADMNDLDELEVA